MGAGRSELARIFFGRDPHRGGEVHLDGKRIDTWTTCGRIAAGLAFLTGDRRPESLCLDASTQENLNLATLPRHARGAVHWLDARGLLASATAVADAVRLTPARG